MTCYWALFPVLMFERDNREFGDRHCVLGRAKLGASKLMLSSSRYCSRKCFLWPW